MRIPPIKGNAGCFHFALFGLYTVCLYQHWRSVSNLLDMTTEEPGASGSNGKLVSVPPHNREIL
jgi:hypothetical protein